MLFLCVESPRVKTTVKYIMNDYDHISSLFFLIPFIFAAEFEIQPVAGIFLD